MKDDQVWRVRAAVKLQEAMKTVYEDDCKGILVMLAINDGGSVYVHLQSNGGDEFSPEEMAKAMKTCAVHVAKQAREVTEGVH